MDKLILLLIAIGLAYAVGCMGRSRKIGFTAAFIISLLNVIIGLIVVLCSKKINTENGNNARQWYYIRNGKRYGPFTINEMKIGVGIHYKTLVWAPGMQNWTEAYKIPELQGYLDATIM